MDKVAWPWLLIPEAKLPVKLLPQLVRLLAPEKVWFPFKNATLLERRASATVPTAIAEPFRLVKLSALPLKVPLNRLALLVKDTVFVYPAKALAGNVPTNWVVVNVPSRLLAVLAKTA